MAQEGLEARVKRAQAAARANMATPAGREWMQKHQKTTDRLMILVLNRCLPKPEGDIPTGFDVYVRLSRAGAVREVLTELDDELGKCMTQGARDVAFPDALRDDYWFELTMAAPL